MKLTKRILALLLVLCFIGLALVGCGGKRMRKTRIMKAVKMATVRPTLPKPTLIFTVNPRLPASFL